MKNIVIIGGGYAGILTAKKLEKKLKKQTDIKITLIDKNPFHTMLTELHEVAAGRVEEDSIKISFEKVFAGRRIQVALDEVLHIDFEKKSVTGKKREYAYDYLVLAAGSKPAFFGVPGAKEYAYQLWSYEDAVILRDRIHTCFRKAATEMDLEEKKCLLTFYVAGAGLTGVEMIGELAEYVPILCEKYEIDKKLVTLAAVDGLLHAVPIFPEKLSIKVERRLNKMGVQVMLSTTVVGIYEDSIELKKGSQIVKHPVGTVIWTAGIESSDITLEAAKELPFEGRGRIWVDSYLRTPSREDVFVIGDNMMYVPEGEERPVPQMVENCEQSAQVAAHNICALVKGTGSLMEYKPSFHGVMVCVGGRYGAARVGFPGRMINLPSFFAMFAKHFINVIYFIQVLGWNKVFSYAKHEFFTIRHCRSFVGGHFSNRTPSFLLVPLRVWLGAVWLFEGVHKIYEGWLSSAHLTEFFLGARSWFEGIIYGTIGTENLSAQAVDGVAQATGSTETVVSGGAALFSYNILGLLDVSFVSGKELVSSGLADYAFQVNIPLMNWFVDHVVLSGEGIQIFMQTTIVVLEILIGLSLIGGLFTTLSAGVSLVLQVMFVCTTGLYLSTFWMIFAGIAVLIGGGRSLGLDYYVMPWLKKKWKEIPFIRKWYLYHDE